MDSLDIIARENEFKKLNRQLEKKTQSLMKEIEQVMKQDMFPDFSHNVLSTPSPNNLKKHCCESKVFSPNTQNSQINKGNQLKIANNRKETMHNAFKINTINDSKTRVTNKEQYNCGPTKQSISNASEQVICHNCVFDKNGRLSNDLEFLYAFVSININEKILPQSYSKEPITVERVCKFLASKIKLLDEQIAKMQCALDKKTRQCEGHLTQLAELESERMSLISKANNMRGETIETKSKYTALNNKMEEKESLYKEQRSINDRLTVEVKQLRSKNASLEARCVAQEDAVDTLKQQLEAARISEKEFRDSSRNLSASHNSAISRLEARVKQLTGCIDKQNALIVNLKQQIAVLTTEGALQSLEKEYNELLNQDFS
ncbi:testis-expressed protein 9 isoform X2 [Battus philenor]|uniref:testis-expressed protein 9 isoform X2 n=1 Tax=Battus philenor TaxID=42288 RepID=UPI0035CEA9BD